jgi:hypothetical protein
MALMPQSGMFLPQRGMMIAAVRHDSSVISELRRGIE